VGAAAALAAMTGSRAWPTPTRDQLCQVRSHDFQGLTVSLAEYGEIPLFGPFGYSLDAPGRAAWRASALRENQTHAIRALSYNYREPGYSYFVPGADFTQDLPKLKSLLAEDISAGLYPVLYLAGDGQQYDPNGGTYGYPWLMQNMRRIVGALRDSTIGGYDYTKVGLHCLGFELISNGGWSPDNFETATILLRECAGPDAAIVSHIGSYTWWGDAAGTAHGPIGDWSSPTGQAIDVAFCEGDFPFSTPEGKPLYNVASDGWEQRAAAYLGSAATNIQPKNRVVYEWPQPLPQQTPRGQRYPVAEELDAYQWVRRACNLADIHGQRACVKSFGFELVG